MSRQLRPTNRVFPPANPGTSTVLNYPHDDPEPFQFYAKSFHKAGKSLLQNRKLDSGGLADFDACPIVFLYRHSLELYLKALLAKMGVLSASFLSHDLEVMLPPIRKFFEDRGWTSDLGLATLKTFDDFEQIVRDFVEVDRGSYAFRFPVDKSRRPSLPHHFTFKVVKFATSLDPVLEWLDGVVDTVSEVSYLEAEARAEAAAFRDETGE